MRPLVRRCLSWINRLSMSLYILAFGLIDSTTGVTLYSGYFICFPDVFECADQYAEVLVRMGDVLLQFVVPTLDVMYGTGYICVEVVPYLSVTVDPVDCNIVRECSCVGWCINVI